MVDSQGSATEPSGAAAKIVEAARTQLGVPYIYGEEDPGVGFDCSGLARWCCAQASISIPRGSADQFTASGPRVDGDIQPGDLVFFYGGETSGPRPGHVGVVTARLTMIDAPYSGQKVRYDAFDLVDVVGPLDFWGATRPAALAVTPPPLPSPATLVDVQLRVLSLGCKGYDVQAVQALLNLLDNAGLATDAIFGPLTEAAVRAYQTKMGYEVSGQVGKATWQSILGAPNT
jgi:hypothetical protein